MHITLLFIVLLGVFVSFVIHKIRTRRMSRALGRDVSDSETLSLNSWMQVVEKEEQQKKK